MPSLSNSEDVAMPPQRRCHAGTRHEPRNGKVVVASESTYRGHVSPVQVSLPFFTTPLSCCRARLSKIFPFPPHPTAQTGSCFMSDTPCEDVCGDGICAGDDTCVVRLGGALARFKSCCRKSFVDRNIKTRCYQSNQTRKHVYRAVLGAP